MAHKAKNAVERIQTAIGVRADGEWGRAKRRRLFNGTLIGIQQKTWTERRREIRPSDRGCI